MKEFFKCNSCGAIYHKWIGQCNNCKKWNTLEQQQKETKTVFKEGVETFKLNEINNKNINRLKTNIEEFDQVIGGGITSSSITLISGSPGIGKSTLLLQIAYNISLKNKVLYISGEESLNQIKQRAIRLNINSSNIELIINNSLDRFLDLNFNDYALIIIDSIQTLASLNIDSPQGSIAQIKYCCALLIEMIKKSSSSLILVAHINKEGGIAGPKIIEHLVDTVLYFNNSDNNLRFLSAYKNRFGQTEELGLFEMTEKGLKELKSQSDFF